ncbi:response regulator [Sulfuriflexus mobilis]|uniref:response regulator n=1 Tax=Sulfuriflexus mobilis TaxID=1811807 RepID=UPI0015596FA2|nr:response regulator [Sulfuriflexus mobilis]
MALLPLTVTVIILSVLFTVTHLQQFEQEQDRRGNAIVRQLAPASEYGVISGNKAILSSLASAALNEPDVISVKITDSDNETLMQLVKPNTTLIDPAATHQYMATVFASQIEISDYPLNEAEKNIPAEVIGQVSIILSNESTTRLQQTVLVENFSIAGIVLFLTIFFALRIARSLSQPLHEMTTAVSHISEGEFAHPLQSLSRGELGELEKGIASMAERLSAAMANEQEQRQHLENTNKEMNIEIEQRKMVETELREATNQANQANQAKSDFLGNMGHELRTPLNSIIGFSELLQMGELQPKQKDYAHSINKSCNDLLHLIKDILDFSKLEAGKLSILSLAFDLRETIEEVADAAAIQCANKNIELIINYPPEQPHNLFGDPGRIRQVLSNLVTNAVKFIEHGHIIIRVQVSKQSGNTASINISVEDTGIGIAREKLDSVFERFTQADSSVTRAYQGLGLGLSISKQLIELMGGHIKVESTLGQGSVFSIHFNLPINAIEDDYRTSGLVGKHVLVADDNAESRNSLAQTLRFFGMRVDTVTDGATALATMHTANAEMRNYHLAFIDSEMPGMDTNSLRTIIRQNNQLSRTRLVLLTPVNRLRERNQDWHSHYSAILTKPVRFNDLLDALQRVFSDFDGFSLAGTMRTRLTQPTCDINGPGQVTTSANNILIVDDNPMNLKLAINILKNMGYTVDTARDGRQAVQRASETFYNIILMDILMPNMNGFDATRAIRKMQKGADKRSVIIALTAKALEGDREQCFDAGMDDYISKPLHIDKLQDILKQYIIDAE